jgi:hypothetical protein
MAEESGTRARTRDPMEKITKKLQQCIESEDFYQAQQLCLSLYNRQKRKDLKKAHDILVVGAKLLLPRGDITAGNELALTLSRDYVNSKVKCSPENLARAQAIIDSYPEADTMGDEEKTKFAVLSCEKFVDQMARWCLMCGTRVEASPLYTKLGRYAFRNVGEKYAGRALLYSFRSNNLSDIARMMAVITSRAKPQEEELVITRVVLQYLNFHCRTAPMFAAYSKVAKLLIEQYQKITNRTITETPLIHFLQLGIEVRERTIVYDAVPRILF